MLDIYLILKLLNIAGYIGSVKYRAYLVIFFFFFFYKKKTYCVVITAYLILLSKSMAPLKLHKVMTQSTPINGEWHALICNTSNSCFTLCIQLDLPQHYILEKYSHFSILFWTLPRLKNCQHKKIILFAHFYCLKYLTTRFVCSLW